MQRIIEKVLQMLIDARPIVILIVFIFGSLKALYDTYIGGQDKRTVVSTLLGLMAFITFIYYIESIVQWIRGLA